MMKYEVKSKNVSVLLVPFEINITYTLIFKPPEYFIYLIYYLIRFSIYRLLKEFLTEVYFDANTLYINTKFAHIYMCFLLFYLAVIEH